MPKVISIREETSEEKKCASGLKRRRLSPEESGRSRAAVDRSGHVAGCVVRCVDGSAETLPAYLSLSAVKWCGILAVVLWLFSLLCALGCCHAAQVAVRCGQA